MQLHLKDPARAGLIAACLVRNPCSVLKSVNSAMMLTSLKLSGHEMAYEISRRPDRLKKVRGFPHTLRDGLFLAVAIVAIRRWKETLSPRFIRIGYACKFACAYGP